MDPDLFAVPFIETGDLDPTYFMFRGLYREAPKLGKRLVVAHLLFYHIGTASWVASRPDFWIAAMWAASSKDYPRGRERRHFRGRFATDVVAALGKLYPEPATIFDDLAAPTFGEVAAKASKLPGFGAYFSIKFPDIMERSLGYRIAEDDSILDFNPTPRASLARFAEHNRTSPDKLLAHLRYVLSRIDAPPTYDRPVGLAEIETVLCTSLEAWERRTYYVGWDLKKQRANLVEPFGDPLGLAYYLPPVPPQHIQDRYFFRSPP